MSWHFLYKIETTFKSIDRMDKVYKLVDSLEKTLILGKTEGRRRGRQRMRWLDGISKSMDVRGFGWTSGVGDRQGGLACCSSWGRNESDTTEQLN